MLFRPFASLAVASTLFTSSSAQLLNLDLSGLLGLNLDVGLLQNGALVNINAFADVLSSSTCATGQTIGVNANLLGLLKICACVNALNLVTQRPNPNACPACTDPNAVPICGGARCACACPADFFAGPTGVCIPRSTCTAPNTIVTSDGGITSTCQCATGYLPNGAGGCVLAPSQRARMSRKQKKALVPRHPHAAKAGHQEVLAARPAPVKAIAASPRVEKDVKPTCPNGETACPLTSGGFECLDVASSLMSCGGCVGDGQKGVNCLAIPGALSVECHDSQCQVASCFKGWRFTGGKCL